MLAKMPAEKRKCFQILANLSKCFQMHPNLHIDPRYENTDSDTADQAPIGDQRGLDLMDQKDRRGEI